jgi:preprotein translocase subunit SecY
MVNFFKKIWTNKELRKNLFIVVLILVLFRMLSHIPIPGADLVALRKFFDNNQVFGLLNIFSGGAMSQFSIVTLGIGPYINASIIINLLQVIVPKLEALSKEGERGQFKINQYTRYLTVPLAMVQSYGFIFLLSRSQGTTPIIAESALTPFFIISTMVTMTAGAMLLTWMGEIISEKGVGNGISLLIFAGIVAQLPQAVQQIFILFDPSKIFTLIAFGAAALFIIAAIVFITEGQRKIPVTYARRVRGSKMSGGVSTHLPLRVTTAGVIPIIFAMSLMLFPSSIAKFFANASSQGVANAARFVEALFNNQIFYAGSYFVLVVVFTYFYTSIVFKPTDIAENLQKQGGFIPGIRPGTQTSEYLHKVMNRITLAGALFLGVIAVLPFAMQEITGISSLVIGGTGLLIVVSVAIEFMKQIEAQLVMKSYEKYY